MRFVSLDFETTGLVDGWPNEPWQLGLVVCEDQAPLLETKREFFFHIAPGRPFSPRAPGRWSQLRDQLAEAPSFAEQWAEIAPCVTGLPLVAHNAGTERTLLTHLAPLTRFGPWIDTLVLARMIYRGLPSYALGDLAASLGFADELFSLMPDRTWHDALFDALAGGLLACRMTKLVDLRGFWK